MDFVFVIDVSAEAIRSDFARHACESISDILYGRASEDGAETCFPSASRVCIITYDHALHFYNLSVRTSVALHIEILTLDQSNLEHPEMLVVADVDDVFVPIIDGLFVNAIESR